MFTTVHLHDSVAPAAWAGLLDQCLRQRDLASSFHYESPRQARRWLAVHEAFSPARRDPACQAIYDHAFDACASLLRAPAVTVIGLGCGGGQKDAQLLRRCAPGARAMGYIPVDASVPLVLTATNTARQALAGQNLALLHPVVCNLTAAPDLPALLHHLVPADHARVLAFFGLLPNFHPEVVVRLLDDWLRPGGLFLLSANLLPPPPGENLHAKILPQYDNPPTREWLWTFPLDLGLDPATATLAFAAVQDPQPPALWRIEARLEFRQTQTLAAAGVQHTIAAGEVLRLFVSYRYTPAQIAEVLAPLQLSLLGQWITPSGEEGVFAFQR